MLIAQISDLHLGFEPDNPDEMNARRLRAVLDHLLALPVRPDLLLATGDLTERGDEPSYRRLRDELARMPMPVLPILGNHDRRDGFRDAWPEVPTDSNGFVQYAVDTPALRLLMLDTLEEGRHGGGFCDARAAWLRERLDEAPGRPTLLVLHHPPFPTGIPWLTTDPREPWVARLAAAINGQPQVVGMVCGHIHRALFGRLGAVPVAVCPSTAPAIALEMQPIDPERPDGRPMVIETSAACAVHLWDGMTLVSHQTRVEPKPLIVSYTGTMQPLVRKVFAERPPASA